MGAEGGSVFAIVKHAYGVCELGRCCYYVMAGLDPTILLGTGYDKMEASPPMTI
jgi:hypothetical protein